MNQGFGQNPFCQYGNSRQQQPYNDMFQHRQAGLPVWNQPMNSHGYFQPVRFSSPQQFHPRGPGVQGCNPRPQFRQQFPEFQPRCNYRKDGHVNLKNKQFQHGKRNNQKKKIDKREFPENNQFFCDTCDRGFCSEEKFEEHVNSHEKCSDPSCSYVAAPKLVKLHFQMQHKTGLASKIWQVDSPEDIKRWIDERKRNFPTASNIEKKKTLESERRGRGEKLDTKYFGKMRGRHNPNNRHGRHGNRKRHFDSYQSQGDDHPPSAKKTSPGTHEDSTVACPGASKGDDPLSAILQQPHSESKATEATQLPCDGVTVAGGLASIMASYAADSETEESPHASPVKYEKSSTTTSSKVTKIKGENVHHSSQCMTNKQKRNHKKKNAISGIFSSKQPTLLERLLANEIRHERNVLLQCVHFIVKKNFFGVQMDGRKSSVGS